ncbi:preprotein translocase subunit SecY [Candidatus Woesearchaeota archaeon]|nr:preprotein translocase subunit SecY [Candidatus Woesearchaeota archaeon]
MSFFDKIIFNLPEVAGPKQKKLPFKEKLKWTLIVLVAFYILGLITIWPLGDNALAQFEYLSIILGAKFGSLISLGISPIVNASIILQLLNGSGILKFNLTTPEGRQRFEGVQKLMAIFFAVFMALIYVFMGGLTPPAQYVGAARVQMQLLLVLQLFLGGMIIIFMDEIVSKWGFGSGVSLFIAAGISMEIVLKAFSISDSSGNLLFNPNFQAEQIVGRVWGLIISLTRQDLQGALLALAAILATGIVFSMAVYAQSMKIEIPLSFGRVRGHGIRWPLHFIYTSNIPVILVASLFATMQLWVRLMQNWIGGGNPLPIIGGFTANGSPVGLMEVLNGPNLVQTLIVSRDFSVIGPILLNSLVYILLMVIGSVIFSLFWVQTSGMDAQSQADQILSSGLQIPGFRRDPRILERLLNRYIGPLTVMGAIVVGLLAAVADLFGALSRGTGILLTVMIVYKLYEDIAREHMYDMNPMLRKVMGK